MVETEQKTEKEQMEGPSELTALLRCLQTDMAQQKEYARKQLRLTQLCTAFFGGLLAVVVVAALSFYPKVNALIRQSEAVLSDLQSATAAVASLDYSGTLDHVNQLLDQSEAGITETMQNVKRALELLESIDIQKLNTAISDLQTAIAPIADLFGR